MSAVADDIRMKLWEPRRALTLNQARNRTNLVKMLRLFFTIGAAASAGVLLGHIVFHTITSDNAGAAPPASGVTMQNPRFSGRDEDGRPFVLVASTAKRRRGEANIVDLERPILNDGVGTRVSATTGVYDRGARTLELSGDVELLDNSGYRFTSDNALMFVSENRIEGQTPLFGEGPLGRVRGDTYTVEGNGEKVILTGNVWTQIIFED